MGTSASDARAMDSRHLGRLTPDVQSGSRGRLAARHVRENMSHQPRLPKEPPTTTRFPQEPRTERGEMAGVPTRLWGRNGTLSQR